MDEDEQQGRRRHLAVRDVHLVQAAEVGFRPLRPRGQEQRKGHQHDIDRADDLTGILALEIGAAIVERREDKPDNHGQHNSQKDHECTDLSLHSVSF